MERSEFNKLLGKRIRNARKNQNITLLELGKLVGISESTVKRYEDGSIKSVSISMLKNFAVALNVHPADLMGWDKDLPSLSPFEQELINKYRTLSTEGKQSVNDYINFKYMDEMKKSKIKDESAG